MKQKGRKSTAKNPFKGMDEFELRRAAGESVQKVARNRLTTAHGASTEQKAYQYRRGNEQGNTDVEKSELERILKKEFKLN